MTDYEQIAEYSLGHSKTLEVVLKPPFGLN